VFSDDEDAPQFVKLGQAAANGRKMLAISAKELEDGGLGSKERIIEHLTVINQMYCPRPDEVTMDYVRDLLAGRKKLIRLVDLQSIKVPRIREFDCETIYKEALANAEIRIFLPEPTPDGKRTVSRDFIFNGKCQALAHSL
jgi:hypothetical protein